MMMSTGAAGAEAWQRLQRCEAAGAKRLNSADTAVEYRKKANMYKNIYHIMVII
jgi:hypothetical protein